MAKTFILKHKDINVLKFSFNENYEIDSVLEIFNEAHIPVGINLDKNKITSSFQNWWLHRSIPASRDKLEQGLQNLNVKTVSELINKSYGLSLTDHYWIQDENINLKWKDINFYENDFSEDVGKALFDGVNISNNNPILNSPDNSSDGNLRKKWIIENGKRFLIKGGDVYSPQESFNEVIAAELMERLNINHAKYKIIHDKQKHIFYSKTLNFTTEQVELVNASHIIKESEYNKKENIYEWFIKNCENKGIKRELFEKDLVKMFAIDFIIANKDRHFRNFGFLRNSENLQWIGLAPVYDSGNSLFEGLADIDLEGNYFTDSKNIQAKPFAENHEEQIKLIPINKFCKYLDFSKLNGFSNWVLDLLKNNDRLSEKRKTLICKQLEKRIRDIQKIINKHTTP